MGTDPSLPKSLGACRERKRSVREGQTLSVGRPKPPCGESADPVSPPPGKPPRGQSVAGTVPRASEKGHMVCVMGMAAVFVRPHVYQHLCHILVFRRASFGCDGCVFCSQIHEHRCTLPAFGCPVRFLQLVFKLSRCGFGFVVSFRAEAIPLHSCRAAVLRYCRALPVSLGAFIARHSFMSMLKPIAWWMFIVFGCIVLYAEWCYVGQRGHGIGNDCYFSLPLVYVPMFMFVKSVQIELDCAKLLRLFSIVVFPMHFSVNSLTVGVLKFLGLQGYISPFLLFWVGVGSAAAVCFAIVQFEKRGVNALKWLH